MAFLSLTDSDSDAEMHSPKPGVRVLIVEDNTDCAMSLAILLKLYGHEVKITYNGPDALQVAQAEMPDVVLIDIGLPGMSGYELAKILSSGRQGKKPHLIAVTGYGQDADRESSKEAGIDLHLVKPVSSMRLESALRAFQKELKAEARRNRSAG